jgi:predicted ferric reductase
VTFVDHIAGWRNEIASDRDDGGPYRIALHRSPSTIAFGAVIVGVLVSLAVVAVLVANLTFLGWRKFQPPMTTWYAAMLFAVVPLRNALPDAPPIGSWIDVTVTLWVIVALVMSMMVFIFCWWRDLKPEPTTQV